MSKNYCEHCGYVIVGYKDGDKDCGKDWCQLQTTKAQLDAANAFRAESIERDKRCADEIYRLTKVVKVLAEECSNGIEVDEFFGNGYKSESDWIEWASEHVYGDSRPIPRRLDNA